MSGSDGEDPQLEGAIRVAEALLTTSAADARRSGDRALQRAFAGETAASTPPSGQRRIRTGRVTRRRGRRQSAPRFLWLGAAMAASLAVVIGAVLLRGGGGDAERPRIDGVALAIDQRVVVPAGTSRTIAIGDGRITLRGPAEATLQRWDNVRRIAIARGSAEALIAPLSVPLDLSLPFLDLTVVGTRFSLDTGDAASLVRLDEGRLRLRGGDGRQLDQTAGTWVAGDQRGLTTPSAPWRFVLGINLNGRAVNVDGHRWLAEDEALTRGLRVGEVQRAADQAGFDVQLREKDAKFELAVDADLRHVLRSNIFGNPCRLGQTLPNGRYAVWLWIAENYQSDSHRFDVRLEGATVATGIGTLPALHWRKYGPFASDVTDGVLDLDLVGHDAHVMGLEIWEVPR